jgi:hypothetical protein
MERIKQIVPQGIKYISEWQDYDLPRGHVIVDKGVTGCGYTEYTLTNNLPTVLCSPRKLLLENKSEQHAKDQNILYLKNENKTFEDVSDFKNRIKTFVINCLGNLELPPKILVTYDSSHYIIECLKELNLLKDFYFIIDEFQSIFLDAFFKSEVEFDFVEYLQECSNVLYLSATPMLDKYLEKVDTFKNLPFYEIDWSNTDVVDTLILQRKFTTSLTKECEKIIDSYLGNKFPSTYTKNGEVEFSKEAVFYFNSVSSIIRVIKNKKLTPSQVNIICAEDQNNKNKLGILSRALGYDTRKGEGFKIGRIPLNGEINKMFTFCTKTAYIGSDFYSDCASSYVFADPNIKSLALDISLDLPQIVGRQRNRNNPFKNNIVIFYRTIRKKEMESYDLFLEKQKERKEETKKLLDLYNAATVDQQQAYVKKLKDGIEVSKYENDYVSISRKTGKPVYNSFIEISQERAWEVSQKDYQNKISVTKSLESLTSNISEYRSEIEKEVNNFLTHDFNTTGVFEKRMKAYCSFMDYLGRNKEEGSDIFYFKTKDSRFRKYYNFYGTKGCSAKKYQEKNLEQGMINISKNDELSSAVHKKFQIGERYTLKEIKSVLQDIYRDLGITSKPKATDLDKYFNLTRIKFSDPKTKKRIEGYLLKSL